MGGPISCVRIPNDSNLFLSTSTPTADEEVVGGESMVSWWVVVNSVLSPNRSTEFRAELLLLPAPALRLIRFD